MSSSSELYSKFSRLLNDRRRGFTDDRPSEVVNAVDIIERLNDQLSEQKRILNGWKKTKDQELNQTYEQCIMAVKDELFAEDGIEQLVRTGRLPIFDKRSRDSTIAFVFPPDAPEEAVIDSHFPNYDVRYFARYPDDTIHLCIEVEMTNEEADVLLSRIAAEKSRVPRIPETGLSLEVIEKLRTKP